MAIRCKRKITFLAGKYIVKKNFNIYMVKNDGNLTNIPMKKEMLQKNAFPAAENMQFVMLQNGILILCFFLKPLKMWHSFKWNS